MNVLILSKDYNHNWHTDQFCSALEDSALSQTKLSEKSVLTLVTAATTASFTVSSSSNISRLATSFNLSSPPSRNISQADSPLRHSRARPEYLEYFKFSQIFSGLTWRPVVPTFYMH